MKNIIMFCTILMCLFIMPQTSFALRCGDNLVSVGDLKNKVLVNCGQPVSKEIIGYIDHVESEKRIRVMVIEEWIVEVAEYGTIKYYSLVFEGNQLTEINPAGEKKIK